MPKRTDIRSIMIIGAGPIVIGQACEFDYSGAQACKALREEGYRVVLVNSNPATIMTDPDLADATYVEPITPDIVARIIERERPDALLPTMGGQTALNTAMSLARDGRLAALGVELIGAKAAAIDMAEDRLLFRQAMDRIGLASPKSRLIRSPEEAMAALPEIGLVIDELIRDHAALRQAVLQLDTGVRLAKLVFDLGDLLERHIRKEERELFPLFERHIERLPAESIGASLEKILAGGDAR